MVLLMALVVSRWWRRQESLTEELSSAESAVRRASTTWVRACACSMRKNGWLFAMTAMPSCIGYRPNCWKSVRHIARSSRIAFAWHPEGRDERWRREAEDFGLRRATSRRNIEPDRRACGWALDLRCPATDGGGGWVATHEDVTEQRRSEAKIIHMAHHDALTDLPNRVLLRERLEQALAGTRRGTWPGGARPRPRPLQRDQ